MITRIQGVLEIDHERGVIYFHPNEKESIERAVGCVLRICSLPKPIPLINERGLDITHMVGTDWNENV